MAEEASADGLIEKGERGDEGAGSGVEKPGDATAKGLMGNACAATGVSDATWKGEAEAAGEGAATAKGEGDAAGAGSVCPSRARAIKPGNLFAGNGTMRGSCGEIGV